MKNTIYSIFQEKRSQNVETGKTAFYNAVLPVRGCSVRKKSLLFIEKFFISLAELDYGCVARFDDDLFAGKRIYAVASVLLFDGEGRETRNMNVLAVFKVFG